VKIEIPEASFELRTFLSNHVVPWVEVSSSKGELHTLSDVRRIVVRTVIVVIF
jgi:hypothetical protein